MSYSESGAVGPRRIKEMHPDDVFATLERDARLIIRVETCEQHGRPLPLGSDTLIVEHLSDDLSAEFGILRAPTLEYGVNVDTERGFAGNASLRKKTLHRMLNDLLDTWESTGVREFILLTAHEHDPHQEALATVITTEARARVVDIFSVDLREFREGQSKPMHALVLAALAVALAVPPVIRAQDVANAPASGAPLTLDDAITLARRNNPVFLAVANNRRTADAAVRSARGAFLPTADASFGTRYQQGGNQVFNGLNFSNNSSTLQSSYALNLSYRINSATFVQPPAARANRDAVDADVARNAEH